MSYRLHIYTDSRSSVRVNRVLFFTNTEIIVTGRHIQPLIAENEDGGHVDIPLELGLLTKLELRDDKNRLLRRFFPNEEMFIGFAFVPRYMNVFRII